MGTHQSWSEYSVVATTRRGSAWRCRRAVVTASREEPCAECLVQLRHEARHRDHVHVVAHRNYAPAGARSLVRKGAESQGAARAPVAWSTQWHCAPRLAPNGRHSEQGCAFRSRTEACLVAYRESEYLPRRQRRTRSRCSAHSPRIWSRPGVTSVKVVVDAVPSKCTIWYGLPSAIAC